MEETVNHAGGRATRRTHAGAEPSLRWAPARHLRNVHTLLARGWTESLAHYHDSFDFCVMDRVRGSTGPRNLYRHWSYDARAGDVLLFEPGELHRAKGGPQADFWVLLVPESELRAAQRELSSRTRDVHWTNAVAPDLQFEFGRLAALLSNPECEPLAIQEALVSALQSAVERHSESARNSTVPRREVAVQRTVEYVSDLVATRPDHHLSLDELVAAIGGNCGKYELCRAFKAATGWSIYQYFKLRKFALARRLLAEKPWRSIEHVAWDLGYTVHSFSRSFHQLFALSPRVYREAFRSR